MVIARRLKKVSAAGSQISADVKALAHAWNVAQLRVGHLAALGLSDATKRQHRNQWSLHGLLREAFSRRTMTQPRRYIDARAVVVHTSIAAQREVASLALAESRAPDFLFVQREFDETPLHVSFGGLAEEISPFARYLGPGGKLVKFKEWPEAASYAAPSSESRQKRRCPRQREDAALQCRVVVATVRASRQRWVGVWGSPQDLLTLGTRKADNGIADVMVQSINVQHGHGKTLQLLVPPRVMRGKTASHIFSALEGALDGDWSLATLQAQTAEGKLVLLVDVADSASANSKAMQFIGSSLGQGLGNDLILYWPQRCAIHQVFRGMVSILECLEVFKRLFCITSVLAVTSRQAAGLRV
jgi:hypothetical protein